MVSAFDCPKGARDTWLKIMPRNEKAKLNRIIVCERHFEPDCIRRSAPDMDEDGNIIMVKLPVPRLKPEAIPTLFPDNPKFVQPKLPKEPKVPKPPRPAEDFAFSDLSSLSFIKQRSAKLKIPAVPAISPEHTADSPPVEPPDEMPEVEDDGAATKKLISRRIRCEKCGDRIDGPCFQHALATDIVYDNPPVALAYSSLLDVLRVAVKETDPEDGLPVAAPEELVITKETLRAGMLFGPLIAPLIPLEEVEEPPRYVLWSEETEEFQAYDLRDNYVCNWIKFIRPTSDFAQVNLVAYQQKDHVYFFSVKEISPDTELRVFVKVASNCKVLDDWVSSLLDHLLRDRVDLAVNNDPQSGFDCEETDEAYTEYEPVSSSTPSRGSALGMRIKYSRNAKNATCYQSAGMEQFMEESGSEYDEYEEGDDEDMADDFEMTDEEDEAELKKTPRRSKAYRSLTEEESAARKKAALERKKKKWRDRRQTAKARYWNGEMTAEERATFEEKRNLRSDRKALQRGKPDRKRKKMYQRPRQKTEMTETLEMTPEERTAFEEKQKIAKEQEKLRAEERRAADREADRLKRERYQNGEMTPEEKAVYDYRRIRHNHMSKLKRARNKAKKLGLKALSDEP